jgi:hypothetical protein
MSLCPELAKTQLRQARKEWNLTKKKSRDLRTFFLKDRAKEYALQMNIHKESALQMIKASKAQKQIYQQILSIAGSYKEKNPLTQVDVFLDDDPTKFTTFTTKEEIEPAIMHRNQCHSQQSLQTPFAKNEQSAQALSIHYPRITKSQTFYRELSSMKTLTRSV